MQKVARRLPPGLVAWRKKEGAEELRAHYLPYVHQLTDTDLLGEMNYWRVHKNAVPLKEGSPQAKLVAKMSKRVSLFDRILTPWERAGVIKACVAMRSRIVPLHPMRVEMPSVVRDRLTKQDALKGVSDADLMRRLASRVGSCLLSGYEMSFVVDNFRKLFRKSDGFAFEFLGERQRAEKLYVAICERDPQLHLEQVQEFKERVGVVNRSSGVSQPRMFQ